MTVMRMVLRVGSAVVGIFESGMSRDALASALAREVPPRE